MTDKPRLIEYAFPLEQTSLDSVHEKNVRHGHISTLHIWPARRPLAACRAALIATLLPDPGTPEKRQELCGKIGGKVVKKVERKRMPNGTVTEREKGVTQGGVLHWHGDPKNDVERSIIAKQQEDLEWFRQEIRKAYGGLPAGQPGKFYIYVIKCSDDSNYIGQTDDLQRRFSEHEMGSVEWTAPRRPLKIIHWEEFDSREEAVRREKWLKSGVGREWIKKEYATGRTRQAGHAPRVLDPFAGGGAIPLEAMRLGCEATAIDINPVAWFILKCTLEYPQKLAGQKRRLPDFILKDREFMTGFLGAQGLKKVAIQRALDELGHAVAFNITPGFKDFEHGEYTLGADLAWHVRAWGRWVLNEARKELAEFYPTYADFQPLKFGRAYEQRPMRLVPSDANGVADVDRLNASEFTEEYLSDPLNPRWVKKPTVAYLWARAVKCKACRATLPLLKTRWLCRKDKKRVLLTMEPKLDKSGMVFGIDPKVPARGGNAAQKREHDKRIGAGTMTKSGATCPCCEQPTMTLEDIRLEATAGRLLQVMVAVVTDGPKGKEYRLPSDLDLRTADEAEDKIEQAFAQVPFGIPIEPTPKGASRKGGGSPFTIYIYGLDQWQKLFSRRQLLALGTVVKQTRLACDTMRDHGYTDEWRNVVTAFLAVGVDRLADYNSNICNWDCNGEYITHTFQRFALPIKWDFSEINPLSDTTGNYLGGLDWVARFIDHALKLNRTAILPTTEVHSATSVSAEGEDLVLTDPPYYDAIPYSDLMDFFYVWLRRTLYGLSPEIDAAFKEPLAPKWDHAAKDGEFIDDASRFNGDMIQSKAAYEEGMFRAFQACHRSLKSDGRLVVVFAHKQPDAWETLVSAIIRAGFVVDGSWPIQTEMGNRTRAFLSAALSSSVWLVCKQRRADAQPGWETKVLASMRTNIRGRLREYWDAGIRGPDFIWAATGPALEAYSQHPIVKTNAPGKLMTVSEFLAHVRAIVVEYAVGRVLGTSDEKALATGDRLDPVTSYYLLHRNDFSFDDAPAGACILYAVSCGLPDRDLVAAWDLLIPRGGDAEEDEGEPDAVDTAEESEAGSGAKFRLKTWMQRKRKSLGYEAPAGRAMPLIDRLHRLMHLWKEGDVQKVDDYLDDNALRRSDLFHRLVQSLIELSPRGSEERSLLESLSNHIGAKGALKEDQQPSFL